MRQWKEWINPMYLVSEDGLIYSKYKNRLVKQSSIKNKYGDGEYKVVKVRGLDKIKFTQVHRMVAEVFVLNKRKDQNSVHHKDYDPSNNHYTNLQWVTTKENNEFGLFKRMAKKSGNWIEIEKSLKTQQDESGILFELGRFLVLQKQELWRKYPQYYSKKFLESKRMEGI